MNCSRNVKQSCKQFFYHFIFYNCNCNTMFSERGTSYFKDFIDYISGNASCKGNIF